MSTFNCYSNIVILNPDNSINGNLDGFDYTQFDYLDLTAYGGEMYEQITTNEQLLARFTELQIEIEITGNSIVLLADIAAVNIPSFKNQEINLIYNSNILDPINYSLFNILNVAAYNKSVQYLFVYSESELKQKLSSFLEANVILNGSTIVLDKYVGPSFDIPVSANPKVLLVNSGQPVDCDFNSIISINLSNYGGQSIIPVTSNSDIVNAFKALNINISISSCEITLLEYTNTASNIETCLAASITIVGTSGIFCNDGQLDFDELNELDFTPFGGTKETVTSNTSIVNKFSMLGYNVVISGCTIYVLNRYCENIPSTINGRKYSIPIANNDSIISLIAGLTFTYNPTANDSDPQGLPLTISKINNTSILLGSSVTLPNGTIITLQANNNLHINTPATVSPGFTSFTYDITNTDNNSDTATISYTVHNSIQSNIDYLTFDCNTSASIDVTDNDIGLGNLQVVKINGINILPNQTLWIIPNSFSVTLDNTGKILTLASINQYYTMGSISYTVSNGGTLADSTVEYNIINTCDLCSEFDIMFTDGGCGKTCWTTLTYNGNVVPNYMLKLKNPDGSFYVMPSGIEFIIAAGIYASVGNNFTPNFCIPLPAQQFTPYIVFSDFGNNIECSNLTFNSFPLMCNAGLCTISYTGPGGISAQLEFDIEVAATSQISLASFTTGNIVPDGIVIYYNGNVLFHSGNSADCPYVTPGGANTSYVSCIGCNYATGVNNTTAFIPVPYVAGVDYARVVLFGYPCAPTTTFWELSIQVLCQ